MGEDGVEQDGKRQGAGSRTLSEISELELIRRCISYENRAWEELIERYGRSIRNVIHRCLVKYHSLRDGSETDEVFQRVLERLLEDGCKVLRDIREPDALCEGVPGSSLMTGVSAQWAPR